jgi:hypothetical protein
MGYIKVEVDVDDVLDDTSVEDLIEELRGRGFSAEFIRSKAEWISLLEEFRTAYYTRNVDRFETLAQRLENLR